MNIFSVLDSSDVEDEVVQKATINKNKAQKESTTNKATDNKQQTLKGKTQSQSKPKEGKEKEVPKAPAATSGADNEPKEKKEDNRGGRPRGKEGFKRGDKHHNAEGDRPRRPKREFERHSGTGRGREVSRGGRGPYGFGNVEQEAQDAEKNPVTAETETHPENVDEAAEPEPESTEVVDAEPEEPQALSYDDFMRQRQEARAVSSVLSAPKSVRVVNSESQFAGLKAKVDEEDENTGPKSGNVKKDQRSTNKAQMLDVQFKFENQFENRGGGRRSNRDGFVRGGRGRGDGRPRRQNPGTSFNTSDFPSL